MGSIPGLGRCPGRGHSNPLQYSCLENSHGQRSPEGYSPWDCKESGMTEQLNTQHNLWGFGQFSSVQFSHSVVSNSATPWTEVHQASLSITNSRSLLKLMSIGLMVPSNSHLIFCHLLLLLPSIFPSIRGFSNKTVLFIRWPNYWSFSFSISPSNEY